MFQSRQASRPAPAGPVARGSSLVRVLPMQVSGASSRIAPVRQWSLSVVGSTGEMRLDQQIVEVPSSSTAMIHTRASPHTPLSSVSATAWRECLLRLTDSEKKLFEENAIANYDELLSSAISASKTQEEKSRALYIAKKLRPLIEAVNLYGGVAQTMVQASPAPAALVLGGINCLMSIPSRFADYQERISDILFEMGRELHNLKKYQAGMYENEPDVDDALIQVYIDMAEFCREATRLLFDRFGKPRSTLRTLLRSTLQPFDYKFGAMAKKFDKDVRHFEKSIKIAFENDRQRFQRHMLRAMGQATDNQNVMGTFQTSFFDNKQSKRIQMRHVEDEINEQAQEKRARILAWLPTVDFEIDQRNNLHKRLEGTGRWLLEDAKFKEWKRKAEADSLPPNILCVQGQSGCGKSCLAALVVDKYTKKSKATDSKVAIAYAYCSKMDAAKFSPVRILSSIMQQLSDQSPGYGLDMLQRVFDKSQRKFPPTEDQLEDAISVILNKFKKVFIVIDGLDECSGLGEEAFGQFCTSLRSIAHARPAVVRLIIFNRPGYTQINNTFQTDPRILVDSVANEEDIKQYIFSVTRGEELLIRNNSELLETVEQILLQKADGMFLWVRLLVQTLKTARTKNQLMLMIKSLPQDLPEVYDRSLSQMLNKATDKELCLRILLWIANAKRPLSSDELKTALQIDDGSSVLNDANFMESEEGITAECGDLIVLRENRYHLLHSSLQDYLTKLDSPTSVKIQEYRELQAKANEILGRACLTYLLFDDFKKGPFETRLSALALLDSNPFLEYAGTCWGYHVTAAGENGFGTLICDFVECDPARELFVQFYHHFRDTKDGVYPYQGTTTPLHALSIFNLVKTASKFDRILQLRNNPDGFGYLPLDYALVEGSREICMLLLKNDSSTQGYPEPQGGNFLPIHVATVNDWGDVIKNMIALGFDPNRPSPERKRTALHEAASFGSQNALLALLEAEVNVNAEDVDRQTPIIEAAEGNHPEALLPLLKAGANLHHQGWGKLTALHRAAVTGNLEIAKLLLQWNAEVDTCAGDGWGQRTPLHIAAENNHSAIAQLLIDHGAKLEHPCSQNYTPLLLAASSGCFEATELLLRSKANISACTEAGDSALHVAASNGHMEIVKLLQNYQPSLLKSLNDRQNTPLHSALQARETKVGLELLRMGSPVDSIDAIGQTALHLATMHDLEEIFKVLISEYGADRNKKGLLGSPPLHYAAQWGHSHLIEPLIVNDGADPEALNDDQQAAVHFAARQKQIDFVRKLVNLVPTINLGVLDKWEQSPLHLAARAGSSDLVRYLAIECKIPCTEDGDKNLPLHLAAWNGHTDCVELLLTESTVNAEGFCHRTALFGASSRGHIATVKLLLGWKADPNILDDFDQGPLIVALKNKHVEVAKLLLASNADPKVPDKWDSIPLHYAALIGNNELVTELLLEAHCDGLCQNVFGDTPFLKAVYANDVGLIDIFLNNEVNGCAITNKRGQHPFEIAALKGNLEMFEKLINASNNLGVDLFSPDLCGDTAICAAASSGETALLDPLLKLGFNVDGPGNSGWTPLMHASSNGNMNFLNALLQKGAKLNLMTEFGFTAIAMAAADKRPRIFMQLLKAEADPLIRNVFGWNALDYAYQYRPLWECLDVSLRTSYRPLDDTTRAKMLRSIIVEKAEAVLELSPILTSELQLRRLMAMIILGNACVHLQTEASNADAFVFFKEISNLPDSEIFHPELRCAICMEERISGPIYTCTSPACSNSNLCETCYLEWIKGSDEQKSIPPGARTLEELERELWLIRHSLWKLVPLGAEIVFNALNLLKPVQSWFDEKLKAYRDWEKQYNDQNQFVARDIPGRDFLEIMAKYQETAHSNAQIEGNEQPTPTGEATNTSQQQNSTPPAIENVCMTGDVTSNEAVLEDLDKQLVQLFKKCRPDREPLDFTCSGHERLKIPSVKWSDEDVTSGPFNENGRITNEWLRDFVEKYKSNESVITEGALTSEPLEIEDMARYNNLPAEQVQESVDDQSPPIVTPAQADAVFLYDAPEQKPKTVPLNFASAPDLQPQDSSINAHPINSNVDTAVNLDDALISNSLSRRGTLEMVEEMERSQVLRKDTADWIQVATSVPLPPSRQSTFHSTHTSETPGLKELVIQKDPGENNSGGEPTSYDTPHAEQEEPDLDPILKSKVDLVISLHKGMREELADSAEGVLRSLAQIDNNVTRGLLGLNQAIDNAASAIRQRRHQGENKPSTTYGAFDETLLSLRIKVWAWDAAFDVLQLVLLSQRLADLVPNYDLDRLLRTENRIVVIQGQAKQDDVLVSEPQQSQDQPGGDAVTPEAVESREQQLTT